jgi:putative lipoic acid-binding regulatory protein
MSEPVNPEDLLEFPCHYTFKAVGASGEIFSAGISAAVGRHATVHRDAIHIRPSGKGSYQSVSIVVRLENYKQLTDIYAGMKEVPGLKMLL